MNPQIFQSQNANHTSPLNLNGLKEYYGVPESKHFNLPVIPMGSKVQRQPAVSEPDPYAQMRSRDNIDEYD